MAALLGTVRASIQSTPRVMLLATRPGDVLVVRAGRMGLIDLTAGDLQLNPHMVREIARTGHVLVAPALDQPRLGAVAAR
jgi:hypothetical protein